MDVETREINNSKTSFTANSLQENAVNIEAAAPTNTSLMESPVLSALRSHIEKWYPSETKKNRLEVEDIIDEGAA